MVKQSLVLECVVIFTVLILCTQLCLEALFEKYISKLHGLLNKKLQSLQNKTLGQWIDHHLLKTFELLFKHKYNDLNIARLGRTSLVGSC